MKENDTPLNFPIDKKYEFIYFPVIAVLFFVFRLQTGEFSYSVLFMGFFHILASNVLTFVYNMAYVALLIPFRLKPLYLKLFGFMLILNAIRVIYYD